MNQGQGVSPEKDISTEALSAELNAKTVIIDKCARRDQFFCAALTGLLASATNCDRLKAVDRYAANGLVADAAILADAAMESGQEYYNDLHRELKNKIADNATLAKT